MRTSATGVSKATFSNTARLYSTGRFLFHLILGYFVCNSYCYELLHYLTGTKQSKMFRFCNQLLPILNTQVHHKPMCSLYFFHFVKEQSS